MASYPTLAQRPYYNAIQAWDFESHNADGTIKSTALSTTMSLSTFQRASSRHGRSSAIHATNRVSDQGFDEHPAAQFAIGRHTSTFGGGCCNRLRRRDDATDQS